MTDTSTHTTALPEGVYRGNEKLIALTDAAGRKVAELLQREGHTSPYLRVAVTGGGCSGLSYKLKFVESTRRGDILIESSGATILVDGKSALYLRGMKLDYSHDLVDGGFKFENPNAKASCSCGESFSV